MKNFVNIFSMLFYKKLRYRGMYAIHIGEKAGCFFIYVKEEDRGKSNAILIMPNPMEAKYVKLDDMMFDIKYKNIKFVQKVPQDVYDVCKANFIYYAKKEGIYAGR